ncbi:MAG TPA: tetratricopeptide repeat protein [Chloroflexota bacterium]|jgi:tetratricopeptide (TPR) repeat protein
MDAVGPRVGDYGQAMREGHAAAWGGRWRDAVGYYRRALAALPEDVTARSSLAAALVHAGQPNEALELFEELARERPGDSTVLLRVAELRHRVGRIDDADQAYLSVAGLYVGAGQNEKAVGVWRRLLHLSSHRPTTMARVAVAALEVGAQDVGEEAGQHAAAAAATAEAAGAVAAAPVEEAPRGEDGEWVADLAARLGAAGLRRARWEAPAHGHDAAEDGAWVRLDDAVWRVATAPNDLGAARELGRSLLVVGRVAEGSRQLADAADAAELEGDLALAAAVIGDLLPRAEDRVRMFRRLARLALLGEQVETAAGAHLSIADELVARGQGGDAVAETRRARAIAPLSAQVQAEAADRLGRLGASGDADDARRRAFQLAPRVARHVVRYAAAAARRGAFEELEIALEALAELGPDAPLAGRVVTDELTDGPPTVALARGRLLAWIGDPAADEELRRAAVAPPPVGPRAATVFAERAVAAGRLADVVDALRPWIGRLNETEDGGERIAGLALSAADAVGDAELALASLAFLVGREPGDTTLGSLYAERLAAAGRPREAALELARIAELELARDEGDTAVALLEAAAALDPDDSRHALRAADLARGRGRNEQARRLYLRAADAGGPGAAAALLAAAELSPPPARTELFRRAISAAPDEAEPRRRLVQALVSVGQVALAVAETVSLSELLLGQGDREGALAAVEQARRLDPWNPGLQALRDALAPSEPGS